MDWVVSGGSAGGLGGFSFGWSLIRRAFHQAGPVGMGPR